MRHHCRCIHVITKSKARFGELSKLLFSLDYDVTHSATVMAETVLHVSRSMLTMVDCIEGLGPLLSLREKCQDLNMILALISDKSTFREQLFALGIFDYIAFPLIRDEVVRRTESCAEFNRGKQGLRETPRVNFGAKEDPPVHESLQRLTGTRGEGGTKRRLVEDVCRYLSANIDSEQTLDGLASRHGTNRNALARAFKEDIGLGVFEWLRRQRIQVAAALLVRTDLGVQQICCEVGYRDAANFSTSFKALIGVSPLQYRKKHASK